jgi:thiamine transporter
MQNHVSKSHLRIRALTEGAILLALAVVLNYLSGMIFASLPQGGSITLAMFPLLLYVHRWGLGRGLLVCFAYGTLDMLLGKGYAWGWQSILLDYLVAYTALAIGGLFKGKAKGIFPGTLVACLGRFAIHYLSGVTIYRIIEPTSIPGFGTYDNPHVYSLVYNAAYMLPNTLLTLALAAVLFVPLKRYFAGSDLKN